MKRLSPAQSKRRASALVWDYLRWQAEQKKQGRHSAMVARKAKAVTR